MILYQNQTFLSYVSSACEVLLKLKSKELIFIERNERRAFVLWRCRPRGAEQGPQSSHAAPGHNTTRAPRAPCAPAGNGGEHTLFPAPLEPHLPSLLGVLGRLQDVLDGRVDFRGGRPRLDFCFSSSFFSSFSPSSLFCRGHNGFLLMFHC